MSIPTERHERIGSFISKCDLIIELSKPGEPHSNHDKQIGIYKSTNEGTSQVPSTPNNRRITNVGYDVSIDCRRVFSLRTCEYLDLSSPCCNAGAGSCVTIPPGHTFSFNTKEDIHLGSGVAALVESKVKLVSKGVSHISTTIDPGWQGTLLLTLSNLANNDLVLYDDDPIATIVFFYLSTPVGDLPEVHTGRNEQIWQDYDTLARDRINKERKRKNIKLAIYSSGSLIIISLFLYAIMEYITAIDKFDHLLREKVATSATLVGALFGLISLIAIKPVWDWIYSKVLGIFDL